MSTRTLRLAALVPALAALGACAPRTAADAAPAPSPSAVEAPDPAPAPVSAAPRHFPADEDLQVMLRYLVEDGETPGIVLGILEADGSTRVLSHGTAGPGAPPPGPETMFVIGSINKTFTGTVLADMVARGEVALDDPVSRHLPGSVRVPSRGGREITLLDLATHTSGLPRMPDGYAPSDPADKYADFTVGMMYDFLSTHELRRDPGAEFEYSNLGMGLLGHALARVAGTSFPELVRERVLEPLGMESTGYAHERDWSARMAKGHDADGNVVPYWNLTGAIAGAGGLRASVEDMLTYLRASVGPAGTPVERAMREAQRPRRRIDDDSHMGLGWHVLEHEGRTLLTHGGSTAGFRSSTGFDPATGVGFVLLANSGGFEDDLGMDFLRRGAPLDVPVVDVPAESLDRYAGTYEPAPGQSIVVRREDDGFLTMRVPGNVRFRMYAESDSSFFLKRTPWRVRFVRDEAGETTGLVLSAGGRERTARRVSADAPLAAEEAAAVLDLPLSAERMARYEGTYALRRGDRSLELRVFAEDGALKAEAAGQSVARLRHQGGHAFAPDFDDDARLVFEVEDGRAARVTLHQNGATIPGERTP